MVIEDDCSFMPYAKSFIEKLEVELENTEFGILNLSPTHNRPVDVSKNHKLLIDITNFPPKEERHRGVFATNMMVYHKSIFNDVKQIMAGPNGGSYYAIDEYISNNITTNTLNNQSNTINNTIILAHGKEDLSKIELEAIMGYMSTFKHREIIPNITKYVYLNDKKPENKNFCVVDTARNKCKYFDGTKWVIGKTNDKVNKIFDNMHNMLTEPFEKENINKTIEFIKKYPKKFNEKWIKISNTYLKSLYDEDDKENMENKLKVLEELKLIFFNNKDEILKIKLKE